MGWLKFWAAALSDAFGVGWVAFGVVSAIIPPLITLVQRHWRAAADVPWIRSVAEYQVELQLVFVAVVVMLYLSYAPYRLYTTRTNKITSLTGQVEDLKKENQKSIEANQLAQVLQEMSAALQKQTAASQKGSLSNRASSLSEEIFNAVKTYAAEDSRITSEERASMRQAADEATRNAVWDKMTTAMQANFKTFEIDFMQRYAPRIAVIRDEFAATGLTDPKLDEWVRMPHVAAPMHTLPQIALRLSQLASKQQEHEAVR